MILWSSINESCKIDSNEKQSINKTKDQNYNIFKTAAWIRWEADCSCWPGIHNLVCSLNTSGVHFDEIYSRTMEMELEHTLNSCIWVWICGLILTTVTIQRYTKDVYRKIMAHTVSWGIQHFEPISSSSAAWLLMFYSNAVCRGLINSSRYFVRTLLTVPGDCQAVTVYSKKLY